MKPMKLALALGTCALIASTTATLAQEQQDSHMLEITTVGVKIGHDMAFRESVKAYHECLVEHEYEGSWSAWRNIGGDGREYHFVSTMENWAEMDSVDEAGKTCWSEHYEGITSHVSSVSTRFARHMPGWSGNAEGYDIVRLHHFRVEDNRNFRETVETITGILKEADYEHLGTWYRNIGNDSNEPDYFVVAHYDDFAAMDADRTSPYDAVVAAAGQDRADELWKQFGDALRDDWDYFTDILHRDEELSHSGEE